MLFSTLCATSSGSCWPETNLEMWKPLALFSAPLAVELEPRVHEGLETLVVTHGVVLLRRAVVRAVLVQRACPRGARSRAAARSKRKAQRRIFCASPISTLQPINRCIVGLRYT